jgi:predicted O-methyltransferase YrrM
MRTQRIDVLHAFTRVARSFKARLLGQSSSPPTTDVPSPAPAPEIEKIAFSSILPMLSTVEWDGEALTDARVALHFGLLDEMAPRGPDWGQQVGRLYQKRPAWVAADTLPGDSMLLYDLVRILRPKRVLELGVATGMGTSVLLAALHDSRLGVVDENGEPRVHAADILSHLPWDATKPIGGAIAEMVPELAHGVRFHLGVTSIDLMEQLRDTPIEFAFVDANHRHPWPLIDTLALASIMPSGSWIAHHDVALVERALYDAVVSGVDSRDWQNRGSQWLFEMWPHQKIRPVGPMQNAAVIRLPEGEPLHLPRLRQLVSMPWEASPPENARQLLRARLGSDAVEVGIQLGYRRFVRDSRERVALRR